MMYVLVLLYLNSLPGFWLLLYIHAWFLSVLHETLEMLHLCRMPALIGGLEIFFAQNYKIFKSLYVTECI